MVFSHIGSLAARAVFLTSTHVVQRTNEATYAGYAYDAIETLQGWYDASAGLWEAGGTTLWWNSANCLTTLADFAIIDQNDAHTLDIAGIISNTYTNAQQVPADVQKTISPSGLVTTAYTVRSTPQRRARRGRRGELAARDYSGFLDDYYDDEGWWALAFIRSWDLTHESEYLTMAETIFADMQGGVDSTCGGGIWWSKDKTYKNAIANELYLSVAAHLANRVQGGSVDYLSIAEAQWVWFKNSGMINGNNTINDGLTIDANGTCTNNGLQEWSYNQGVVLGGLAELATATRNTTYLDDAVIIAEAAIALLSDAQGVIHEKSCEPNCGADGSQFKGIFLRNLQYLYTARAVPSLRTTIVACADSVWANDRNTSNDQLGLVWTGPVSAGGGPNATTQSSAMDALVAAMAVV